MWTYETEDDAIRDVLRLSRVMTYKSAVADLPVGGGKGVIIGDSRTLKIEALLRSYGAFVDTLGGRFLTTTDVGASTRDLEYIRLETKHVLVLPVTAGGSGDTSIMTGLGIYVGMKACAKEVWGSDSLMGEKIVVQGFGKVAFHMAHHLLKENAQLIVSDIYEGALDRARELGIKVVPHDNIYDVEWISFRLAPWAVCSTPTPFLGSNAKSSPGLRTINCSPTRMAGSYSGRGFSTLPTTS